MNLSEKKSQELKDEKISIEELNDKHFYTKKDRVNVENILRLLNENICSFKQIVDKFKSIKDFINRSSLWKLLWNEKFLKELSEHNRLNEDDLRYVLNKIDRWHEIDDLRRNTILLKYIVDKDIVSFKELVDKFKSFKNFDNASCLYILLQNKELFQELIENNRLSKDDLKYLLNTIDKYHELNDLCLNAPLLKYILNEFVLSKEDIDRFNTMIENIYRCKKHNIHTIFEYIEYQNKNNEEILELNELNKYTYSFDENQKLELIEVLKNNEIAKNRLIQIINNNLESNYDFDSLMNYLKKVEKKTLLNI